MSQTRQCHFCELSQRKTRRSSFTDSDLSDEYSERALHLSRSSGGTFSILFSSLSGTFDSILRFQEKLPETRIRKILRFFSDRSALRHCATTAPAQLLINHRYCRKMFPSHGIHPRATLLDTPRAHYMHLHKVTSDLSRALWREVPRKFRPLAVCAAPVICSRATCLCALWTGQLPAR